MLLHSFNQIHALSFKVQESLTITLSKWIFCRRAILTKRAVPIKGQLRSHKLFAKSLDKYIDLVDHVRIYSTTEMYRPAQVHTHTHTHTQKSLSLIPPGLLCYFFMLFTSSS
jgi:hypothetical protein